MKARVRAKDRRDGAAHLRVIASLREATPVPRPASASTQAPLPPEHPLMAAERAWFANVADAIEAGRKIRDAMAERVFETAFGGGTDPVGTSNGRS